MFYSSEDVEAVWRDLRASIATAMLPSALGPAGLLTDEPAEKMCDLMLEIDGIDDDRKDVAFAKAHVALASADTAHAGEGVDFAKALAFLVALAPVVFPGCPDVGEAPSAFMRDLAAKVGLAALSEAAIAFPDDGPEDGYYADVRDRWVRHFVAVHAAA